jgi:hypothetical protein
MAHVIDDQLIDERLRGVAWAVRIVHQPRESLLQA